MPKIIRAPINPKVLEWALKDLNLSVDDFSKKVRVKPEKVNEWLEGEKQPTYNQLEDISYRILKLPLAAFFLLEPPKNLSIKKKFRTLPEYLLDLTSYKTRIAIKKAEFFKFALKELFGVNPSGDRIFEKIKLSIRQDPAGASVILRNELKINLELQKSFGNGYQAFNHYREVLENKGIFLFQLQLEGDRGFCLLDEDFPLIIVNSSDSINSKIFTLFHELVHILLETDDIYKEVEPPHYSEAPIEKFCNWVASEILLPFTELQDRYGAGLNKCDEELITKISTEYSVSREVVLLKLVTLRYANNDDYKRLKKKWDEEFIKSRTERSGGDYYINKISALGKLFINVVIESYKQGKINDLQVSNYLDIKFANLPKIEAEVYAF
ncbi:hypothetical protein BMS3Abin03_00969 [bacterium BMS3Abin03]|nr:hypothetical protein BMS3Abin03_00969 [bacterium BMS3Abin03]